MRIVVTGATGNVGTALLRRLAAGGEHELVGLARRVPDPGTSLGDRVSWVAADLTDPACQTVLDATFRGADAVVHLAWGFQPSHDLGHLAELGVGGTQRVIDAVDTSGVPHLVHMSSIGAYSPKRDDLPVDETYPTGGIASSPYSRHKSQAERLLDAFALRRPDVVLTRMRPGIIGQRTAGASLLRYGLPALVPARVLRALPLLPLDGSLRIPMVHADDVADAFALALTRRAGGAFNLAADPPVTVEDIAAVLGARHVQLPARLVRAAAAGSWHARLQPVDPGWIDLAYQVPLLDTGRALRELGWSPVHDGPSVLAEVIDAMADSAYGPTPVLRPRTVGAGLRRAVRRGPVSSRHRP